MTCDSFISPHLFVPTKGQRSLICGQLFLSSVLLFVVKGGGGEESIGTLTQSPLEQTHPFLKGFLLFIFSAFLVTVDLTREPTLID